MAKAIIRLVSHAAMQNIALHWMVLSSLMTEYRCGMMDKTIRLRLFRTDTESGRALTSAVNALIIPENLNRCLHGDFIISFFLLVLHDLKVFQQSSGINRSALFADCQHGFAKNNFHWWQLGGYQSRVSSDFMINFSRKGIIS